MKQLRNYYHVIDNKFHRLLWHKIFYHKDKIDRLKKVNAPICNSFFSFPFVTCTGYIAMSLTNGMRRVELHCLTKLLM